VRKIFLFLFFRNCGCIGASRLARGTYASSRTLRRAAMDVMATADGRRCRGRSSRVVLTPRRWCHVCDDAHASRRQWWPKSPAHQGEREVAVKTVARGMPDVSAEPVVTAACLSFCRRAMGEASARHSPRPLFEEGDHSQSSDAMRVARGKERVSWRWRWRCRTLRCHRPRRRSIQYAALPRFKHGRFLYTGSPGQAGR